MVAENFSTQSKFPIKLKLSNCAVDKQKPYFEQVKPGFINYQLRNVSQNNSILLIKKNCKFKNNGENSKKIINPKVSDESFFNNRMGTEVVGPGGIWGRVQGVGSGHWGTRSQP